MNKTVEGSGCDHHLALSQDLPEEHEKHHNNILPKSKAWEQLQYKS
jgi:hypothetical protein